MTDKEFKAKTKIFQAKFMELFNAHAALLSGDSDESKAYQAYMVRLSSIFTDESISEEDRADRFVEEQDYSPISYVAEDLAGGDDELFASLWEAMSNVERTTALVHVANNNPEKHKARKPRARTPA